MSTNLHLNTMNRPRLGFFGGTFNPIHKTHLAMAKRAIEVLELDMLYWIPNAVSPHKEQEGTSYEHRCAMIELAIEGEEKMELSRLESEKTVHYTADTVKILAEVYPTAERFFLVGEDSLRSFDSWVRPKEVTRYVNLAVLPRGRNSDLSELSCICQTMSQRYDAGIVLISMEPNDLASHTIREMVRLGVPIETLVTASVKEYIDVHALYREN